MPRGHNNGWDHSFRTNLGTPAPSLQMTAVRWCNGVLRFPFAERRLPLAQHASINCGGKHRWHRLLLRQESSSTSEPASAKSRAKGNRVLKIGHTDKSSPWKPLAKPTNERTLPSLPAQTPAHSHRHCSICAERKRVCCKQNRHTASQASHTQREPRERLVGASA